MYQLKFLNKENELNKLIKQYKRSRYNLSILFISLWDEFSTGLVDKLKGAYASSEDGEKLYIVDSFHMPHSFVIYGTNKVPHLVQLKRDGFISEDYYPMILDTLKVK